MNRLYRLLAFGYFPKELPPIFSTKSFARHVNTLNQSQREALITNTWQECSPLYLEKNKFNRRRLDILAPEAMFRQANLLSDNYGEIKDRFEFESGQCSFPAFNRNTSYNRAVRPYAIGKAYLHKKLELRAKYRLILKIDIKNYYKSIYTHSIPWAFHGKQFAKNNMRDNSLLGNRIDKVFSCGQAGQTIGIPVGPDTSFIVSEMILDSIVKRFLEIENCKDDQYIRFYDDFEFGCDSETQAYKILKSMETVLREFELEINPSKVNISSGDIGVEKPWVYQLKSMYWSQNFIGIEELIEKFSFVNSLAKLYVDDSVYGFFLRLMNSYVVSEKTWPTYQNILMSLLTSGDGISKYVFQQINAYLGIGYKLNKNLVTTTLDRQILNQLNDGPTSELSWALFGYEVFDLKLKKDIAEIVLKDGDVASKTLCLRIVSKRNLPVKNVLNRQVSDLPTDVLNSNDWLFAYEALLSNWSSTCQNINIPERGSGFYETLIDNNISFVDFSMVENFRRKIPRVFIDKVDRNIKINENDRKDFISSDELEAEAIDDEVMASFFSVYG